MRNSTNVGTKKPIWKRWWFIAATIIVALFAIIIAIGLANPSANNENALAYEIVEKTDQSRTPNEKRFELKIVVTSLSKQDQIEPVFNKIVSDYTKENPNTTELWMYLLSDKELLQSGTSYDIAYAVWNSKESPNVQAGLSKEGLAIKGRNNNLEEYLQKRNANPEAVNGLSEETRKAMYKDLRVAQAKATEEAYAQYPTAITDPRYVEENITKSVDKETELADKYVAEVRAKYGISKETELAIMGEGVEKHWPVK